MSRWVVGDVYTKGVIFKGKSSAWNGYGKKWNIKYFCDGECCETFQK